MKNDSVHVAVNLGGTESSVQADLVRALQKIAKAGNDRKMTLEKYVAYVDGIAVDALIAHEEAIAAQG